LTKREKRDIHGEKKKRGMVLDTPTRFESRSMMTLGGRKKEKKVVQIFRRGKGRRDLVE